MPGTVPYSRYDPVDDRMYGSVAGKKSAKVCVSKDLHLAGRYKDSPLYCPAAWIRRLGNTREVNATERGDSGNFYSMSRTFGKTPITMHNTYPLSTLPSGEEFRDTLHKTCERIPEDKVNEARDICESVFKKYNTNREDLIDDFKKDGQGEATETRIRALRANCDVQFCGTDSRLCAPDDVRFMRSFSGWNLLDSKLQAVYPSSWWAKFLALPSLIRGSITVMFYVIIFFMLWYIVIRPLLLLLKHLSVAGLAMVGHFSEGLAVGRQQSTSEVPPRIPPRIPQIPNIDPRVTRV